MLQVVAPFVATLTLGAAGVGGRLPGLRARPTHAATSVSSPAHAKQDWRALLLPGAEPVLPTRFVPLRTEPKSDGAWVASARSGPPDGVKFEPTALAEAPPASFSMVQARASMEAGGAGTRPAALPSIMRTGAMGFSMPLFDRKLSAAEKSADIEPELQDAIVRIEPMYDPTRLDGTGLPPGMGVSAGTASMDNVFADHWRLADPDANVDAKVAYLAFAWQMRGEASCDGFTKRRPHGFGEPTLSDLSQADCDILQTGAARGFASPTPAPIVVATISVPVFAAPLPGARQSSDDFWAAQKARIAAIQAHLHQKWQGRETDFAAIGTRP